MSKLKLILNNKTSEDHFTDHHQNIKVEIHHPAGHYHSFSAENKRCIQCMAGIVHTDSKLCSKCQKASAILLNEEHQELKPELPVNSSNEEFTLSFKQKEEEALSNIRLNKLKQFFQQRRDRAKG